MTDFFDNIKIDDPALPAFAVLAAEVIEDDPRLKITQPEIARMYQREKEKWRDLFFPGFEGLPFSAVRDFGQVKGTSGILELVPWGTKAWQDLSAIKADTAKGAIDPVGKRLFFERIVIPGKPKRGNRPATPDKKRSRWSYEVVPIEEYVEWCDSLNFFRNGGISPNNGGPGLNPRLFEGGAWDIRTGNYWKLNEKQYYRNPIRCEAGIYFGQLGPGVKEYPYGANTLFFANGDKYPMYIGDKWGPDYRNMASRSSQEEYDELCWKLAAKWI